MHRDYVNPYIPVAPHGIDPSLAVGITNPGGPNPLEGNVLLCSVSLGIVSPLTAVNVGVRLACCPASISSSVCTVPFCLCCSFSFPFDCAAVSLHECVPDKRIVFVAYLSETLPVALAAAEL